VPAPVPVPVPDSVPERPTTLALFVATLVACGPESPTNGGAEAEDPHAPSGCFAQVEVGADGTFALEADGTLWTWGGNGAGQRGIGSTEDPQPTPVRVEALGDDVVHVSGGTRSHACAVTADTNVWCWGYNDYGQVGDGSTLERHSPFRVGLTGVAEVSAGDWHTCARKHDGTLWCWGEGRSVDGRFENHLEPVQIVPLGDTVVQASVGSSHACAVKTDGSLWCWGRLNRHGQIGDGTLEVRYEPVQVTALGNEVAQVSAGSSTTCAVKTDGTLWCWGENDHGEVGDGTAETPRTSPVQVASLDNEVTQVSTRRSVTCARTRDGSAWCWGQNAYGELGDGTIDHTCELVGPCEHSRYIPAKVEGLGDVVTVSVGTHVCVLQRDDAVWCWGGNSNGSLGDGTTEGEPVTLGLNQGVARPSPVRSKIACG
jgi:alpha-tubulin suppressor-like RCC1 family protein